jgi:hypothetical protein
MKNIIFLFFFQIINISLFAQEVLNDLYQNPILVDDKHESNNHKSVKTPLTLPFFDDFSYQSHNPTTSLWQDDNVFVNTTTPINPPSIGVATFDAVDSKGFVYKSMTEEPKKADILTSNEIDLSNANRDSTWLSFYYQPQGHGNAPEYNDSLILQFIANGVVYPVWYSNGTDYISFKEDSLGINKDRPDTLEFKLVHIKLDNPNFFTNNFQIQFVNYASITGVFNPSGRINADFWNIDYIYLNDNRTSKDTIFDDLALVTNSTLFMTNYSSVPWSHYKEVIVQELSDIYFHVRNNNSRVRTINEFTISVENVITGAINNYYIGRKSIASYTNNPYLLWNFIRSPVDWYPADSAVIKVTGQLDTGVDDFKGNNTTSRVIKYKNYYAYDDGSAEKAYGVDVDGAKVAYKYEIPKEDTLRAFEMYFVRNKEEYASVQSFNLCVWSDYNGEPGDIILEEDGKKLNFSDNINEFVSIKVDSAIALSGTFYIGWKQNYDLLMNVGYDANTIRNNKIFYNVNSQWYLSDFKGSLMMRPVFSEKRLQNSIKENRSKLTKLAIAPNPSSGIISILEENTESAKMCIYDYTGREVLNRDVDNYNNIDISELNSGIYILVFYRRGIEPKSTKLIIIDK